jgi:hypothetical protein
MSKPYLLLDVDGVINVHDKNAFALPEGWRSVQMHDPRWYEFASVPPGVFDRLRRLGEIYEIVWCTGWEEIAAPSFSHALACDCEHEDCAIKLDADWEHIPFPDWTGKTALGMNWKWSWVLPWLEERGRPAVWIDDDFHRDDFYKATEAEHGLELFRINPSEGLRELDTRLVLDHVRRLS